MHSNIHKLLYVYINADGAVKFLQRMAEELDLPFECIEVCSATSLVQGFPPPHELERGYEASLLHVPTWIRARLHVVRQPGLRYL